MCPSPLNRYIATEGYHCRSNKHCFIMGPSDYDSTCADVLDELIETLREVAPRLNQELPFPQRMAITNITAGQPSQDTPKQCSTMLSLRAGGVSKSYRLKLSAQHEHFELIVSDESDFEDRLMLPTGLEEPVGTNEARSLYEILATDIAGHFGTDA